MIDSLDISDFLADRYLVYWGGQYVCATANGHRWREDPPRAGPPEFTPPTHFLPLPIGPVTDAFTATPCFGSWCDGRVMVPRHGLRVLAWVGDYAIGARFDEATWTWGADPELEVHRFFSDLVHWMPMPYFREEVRKGPNLRTFIDQEWVEGRDFRLVPTEENEP